MGFILKHITLIIAVVMSAVHIVEGVAGEIAGSVKQATVVSEISDFITNELKPPKWLANDLTLFVTWLNDFVVAMLNKFRPGWSAAAKDVATPAAVAAAPNDPGLVTAATQAAQQAAQTDAAPATGNPTQPVINKG